jgi:hypothetical protein
MVTDKLVNSGDPVMSALGLHVGLGASQVLGGHIGGVEGRYVTLTSVTSISVTASQSALSACSQCSAQC